MVRLCQLNTSSLYNIFSGHPVFCIKPDTLCHHVLPLVPDHQAGGVPQPSLRGGNLLLLWGSCAFTFLKSFLGNIKNWPNINYHLIYTITCFLIQYLLPSIIIGFIYWKVCKSFPIIQTNSKKPNIRLMRKMARRRRTNNILIGISLVFFICWAPINILNISLNINTMFKVCWSTSI